MKSIFEQTQVKSSPPRRFAILALPIVIIFAVISLFLWISKDALIPVVHVDAAKVRLSQGNVSVVHKKTGTVFQAAGWIEADPYPVRVTALVSGVVKNIHVIAGQQVKKGQLLAELIDEDLQLQLRMAQAHLRELQAKLHTKKAEILIHQAHGNKLVREQKTQQVALKRLQHKARSLRLSNVGIAQLEIEQADFSVEEQILKVKEFDASQKIVALTIEHMKKEIREIKQRIQIQQVQVDKIQLDIRRLQITAPISGIIQRLYVRRGRKQMLDSDNEISTTVAKIYNPQHLQVRVDVPLADIAKVSVGQKTVITVEASNTPLNGVVTILGGEADYQKNTLEVKVHIQNPLAILRPEMLAQVKFLQEDKIKHQQMSRALFVHKDGIFGDKSAEYVWVISLQNRVEKRRIRCGGEREDWLAVTEGLRAGERIVMGEEALLFVGKKVQIRRLYE